MKLQRKKLKQAVKDFNAWQGPARIYYDKSDGDIWTNIYTAPEWWDEYHSPDISEVCSKATIAMTGRNSKISEKRLQALCYSVSGF